VERVVAWLARPFFRAWLRLGREAASERLRAEYHRVCGADAPRPPPDGRWVVKADPESRAAWAALDARFKRRPAPPPGEPPAPAAVA
jgi:hypothetical protein